MALVIASIISIDFTAASFIVNGTITVSGNYGGASTHGDTLAFQGVGIDIPSGAIPFPVNIQEQPAAGTSQTGWRYVFNPGTTPLNGVVQVFGNGTSGQGQLEYTQAAAYAIATPAVPATLYFSATFAKL